MNKYKVIKAAKLTKLFKVSFVNMVIMLTCLLTACGYRNYQNRNMANASGQAVSGGGAVNRSSSNDSSAYDKVSGSAISGSNASGNTVSANAVSGSGIYASDNVTADMQQVDYWIDKTVSPDKILMTETEIAELNAQINEKLSADPQAVYFDLEKYGESIDGLMLRNLIGQNGYPAETYYIGDKELTEEQWNSYIANCGQESIADFNRVRYGIICSRADVRMFPTMDNVTDVKGDTGHDVLQYTALAVNEPVLVVQASRDNNWYFVIANEYAGWVRQDTVALCKTRQEWQRAQAMDDFIVVTGDEIRVSDSLEADSKGWVFTMGTKLALASQTESADLLGQRNVYDNYIVKAPVRMDDGQLDYQLVLIPLGKDVTYGYLEYTRGNVLRQAFKLLGNPYGWGGMNGGRDCSSMTRDIYLCFGFRLPRDAATQAMIPGKNCISLDGMSGKEIREKMNSAQPGTILQMPGHVMIYLGCQDQHYYVISANGTFIPDGGSESGNNQTRLVTINDLGVRSPSNGKTWGEQITAILGIP